MSTASLLGSFCGGGISMVIGIWVGGWRKKEEKKRKIKRALSDFDNFLKFCRCSVCHMQRPDEKISVITHDVSEKYNCEPGIVTRNIRYCNDCVWCIEMANDKSHWMNKNV